MESHLAFDLNDHLNSEIVAKTVENAHKVVDLLKWTFYCTRLPHNPNYYSLKAVNSSQLSNHLSELVEATLDELDAAGCVTKDDDLEVTPQNAGMIASYYYIKTGTVDIFSQALTAKRKLKGLMDILCNATEFDDIGVRQNEHNILEQMARRLPLKISKPDWYSSPTKANVTWNNFQNIFVVFLGSFRASSKRNPMVQSLWKNFFSTYDFVNEFVCRIIFMNQARSFFDFFLPVYYLSKLFIQLLNVGTI